MNTQAAVEKRDYTLKHSGSGRKYRLYTEDFRKRAVEAYRNRGKTTVSDLAKQLGVSDADLYRWATKAKETKKAKPKANGAAGPHIIKAVQRQPDTGEFHVLTDGQVREIARLNNEIARLQKALGQYKASATTWKGIANRLMSEATRPTFKA